MKLSFHGAAQTVTGSCHLLEAGGHRILIECGLLQGGRDLNAQNDAPFGFDPKAVTGADRTFLVHGEAETMAKFAGLLPAGPVELPHLRQSYTL